MWLVKFPSLAVIVPSLAGGISANRPGGKKYSTNRETKNSADLVIHFQILLDQ